MSINERGNKTVLLAKSVLIMTNKAKGIYGEGEQKEIYAKTKAQSGEDRARLQEARREQERSVAAGMGNG